MNEIKFYAVESLPTRLSQNEDGVYFVKSRTSIVFKYYLVSNGRAYEIDAISADRLVQALSTKFDKPNGTQFQYIKGDGTYGLMNKEAVGLGNVDNTSDLNKPISTATQLALDKKADDNKVVHIEGYELITGDKEFSKHVLNPTYPTDPTHLVNKRYVDDVIVDLVLSEGMTRVMEALQQKTEKAKELYKNLVDNVNEQYVDTKVSKQIDFIKPKF